MASLGELIKRMAKMTDEYDFETELVELMNSYYSLLKALTADPMTISVVIDGVTLAESRVGKEEWSIKLSQREDLWKRLAGPIKQASGKRKSSLDLSPLSLQKYFERITPLIRDLATVTEEEALTFKLQFGAELLVQLGANTKPNLAGSFGLAEIRFPAISKFLKLFV